MTYVHFVYYSIGKRFSVVIDGSKQKLRDIKMTVRIVQQCLKDRVYVVYIVQPHYTKARLLLWLQKTSLPITVSTSLYVLTVIDCIPCMV